MGIVDCLYIYTNTHTHHIYIWVRVMCSLCIIFFTNLSVWSHHYHNDKNCKRVSKPLNLCLENYLPVEDAALRRSLTHTQCLPCCLPTAQTSVKSW